MKTQFKGSSSQGLMAATWGFFLGFAALAVYSPLAKQMKELMGLSGFLLGLLVAIPQLTGSLLRIPFGAWADSTGAKKPFLLLLSISALGIAGLIIVFMIFSPQKIDQSLYPVLLALGILCGFGVATFSVGIAQTSYWFPQSKQGYALGLYAGIGNLAPGIFIFLVPVLFNRLGIVGTYLVWFAILITGILIYAIVAKDAHFYQLIQQGTTRDEATKKAQELGQELIPSSSLIESLKNSAKISKTWTLVFLYFTSFGGFLAFSAWLPAYWSIFHQQSILSAGIITAFGFSLLSPLVRAWTGTHCDRWGGERITLTGFLLITSGTLILALTSRFFLSLLGEIVIAIGMGMANAAILKMVPKYIPQSVGGAAGWIGGLGAFGGFVFPPLFGLFADMKGITGYAYGFLILTLFAILAAIVAAYTKKHA